MILENRYYAIIVMLILILIQNNFRSSSYIHDRKYLFKGFIMKASDESYISLTATIVQQYLQRKN